MPIVKAGFVQLCFNRNLEMSNYLVIFLARLRLKHFTLCENVYQQLSKIILVSKIYIFSGLGVDKRVFDNIDFGTKSPEFIDWISPLKNESLAEYSKRISEN